MSSTDGTGTVDLLTQTIGNASETGGGNLLTTLATKAGAVVSVQYDYVAAETPPGGGSDAGSVFQSFAPILGSITEFFTNSVTTAAQTFTIDNKTAGWSDFARRHAFNPTLGTLEAVDITLNGSIIASVSAENTGDSNITFNTTQEAVITLGFGGASNASVALTANDSMTLLDTTARPTLPAHRAIDLGLTEATSPFGVPSFSASEFDPAVLAAFTGTGTVDLPNILTGKVVCPGWRQPGIELTLDPGADVEISYVYTPSVACFAAGTHIMTDFGPVAVEHLTVGMQAVTARTGVPAPIVWIGHRTVDAAAIRSRSRCRRCG